MMPLRRGRVELRGERRPDAGALDLRPQNDLGDGPGLIGKFLQNFANFWRALSRLYQNEILQENNLKYAFDSIFQALQDLHTFAPLQSQNFSKILV